MTGTAPSSSSFSTAYVATLPEPDSATRLPCGVDREDAQCHVLRERASRHAAGMPLRIMGRALDAGVHKNVRCCGESPRLRGRSVSFAQPLPVWSAGYRGWQPAAGVSFDTNGTSNRKFGGSLLRGHRSQRRTFSSSLLPLSISSRK